jgi:polygalacturonase
MSTIFADVRFLRGLQANLPSLEEGQPAFTEDEKRVFIGSDAGNVELAKQESMDTIEGRLDGLDQRSKNVWMDVKKDFEAKGDGVTDDTISIQNAFNYARDNGSVKLYFPEGTYCISNSIQAYKNTTVEWHPNAGIKRIGTYYKMFVNGDPTNESYVLDGGYSGEGNIHFYGGTFDMNCQVGNTSGISPTQTVTFFDLGHAENISFNNITVKNGQSGHYFQVSSCKNVRFKDCWFGDINYTGDGTNYSYECIQIEVATNESFPDFGIYDLTISKDVYIEDCTFDGVIRGIGTHSDGKYGTTNVIFCENIQVKDCVFRNVTDVALNLTGYRYSVFENNLIDTTGGYGFNINVCEDNKIISNTIFKHSKSGF